MGVGGQVHEQLAQRPGRPAEWQATEVGCGAGGNLLDLLRLGAYQLLRTRVEPHAALDTTVSAAAASLLDGVPARPD